MLYYRVKNRRRSPHAVFVSGIETDLDDNLVGLITRNSWGMGHGDNGYELLSGNKLKYIYDIRILDSYQIAPLDVIR